MQYAFNTALEIATRGFYRMQEEVSTGKYTVFVTAPGKFEIRKKTGAFYRVEIFQNPEDRSEFFGSCTCPFCDLRQENLICKHIVFCKDLVDWCQVYSEDSEDYQSAINRAQEAILQAEEDARYDALAQEWEEGRAFQHLTGYLLTLPHTHEREDLVFDAIA